MAESVGFVRGDLVEACRFQHGDDLFGPIGVLPVDFLERGGQGAERFPAGRPEGLSGPRREVVDGLGPAAQPGQRARGSRVFRDDRVV